MNAKQNVIFFALVILMIVSLVTSGKWSILWDGIFHSSNGPPKKKTQVGIIPPGKNHSCPAGFKYNPVTHMCDRIPTPPLGH